MEDEIIEFNYKKPRKKKSPPKYDDYQPSRWHPPDDDEIPWIPIRPQLRTSTTATTTTNYTFADYTINSTEMYRFIEEKPEPPKPPQRVSFWQRILHPFKTFG